MGSLTNSIDYCKMHCDFGKREECFFKDKNKCYENSMFEKLKAYEDIIDDPEKLKEIDALYLERCDEINALKEETQLNKTKEFVEKLTDWMANHHRVAKTDEDLGWNRAIYACEESVKQLAEEYNSNLSEKLTGWIPCEEKYPDNSNYILLSFSNFPVPTVGRWEENDYGGAFYIGDEMESCVSCGLFVNAWQPLPSQYKEEEKTNIYSERFNRVE